MRIALADGQELRARAGVVDRGAGQHAIDRASTVTVAIAICDDIVPTSNRSGPRT
jgi:hypothetical protein